VISRVKIAGLFVALTAGVGLFALIRDGARYARDMDLCLHCASKLNGMGQQLHIEAQNASPLTNRAIEDAVASLVRDGRIEPDQLNCKIAGAPFCFQGTLADLGRPDAESVVIAYESLETHHRRTGAYVLLANGRVQRLKSDQFGRVVTTDKPK
jgi:hypothetical protein